MGTGADESESESEDDSGCSAALRCANVIDVAASTTPQRTPGDKEGGTQTDRRLPGSGSRQPFTCTAKLDGGGSTATD